MSDATPVTAQLPAAPNAAGSFAAHGMTDIPGRSESDKVTPNHHAVKTKEVEESSDTSLSYSVDRDGGALHLKVSNSKGETIRELTFTDFASAMKTSSLAKGVLVDDRS